LVLWAAAAYFLGVPLAAPRGVYGWGHYRLVDIYAGLPLLLAAFVTTAAAAGRKRAAFRLASIAISSLASIVLIDALYAIAIGGLFRQPEPSDFWFDGTSVSREDNLPDPELGFKRKPNINWRGRLTPDGPELTYRTDERGFRNPPGLTRADIVFIGDSFTEAASVDEERTFVRLAGQKTGMSAANLGVGHYGPQQELLTLERHGLALGPKAVVWQVFEGNDLGDALRFARWRAEPVRPESWGRRYADSSLVVRLLDLTRAAETTAVHRMRLPDGSIGNVHLDYSYAPEEASMNTAGFDATTKAIRDAHELCRSRSIRFVLLYIPIKVRVLGPYVLWAGDAERDKYLPGGKLDDDNDLARRLERFCRELDCSFIDATATLREAASRDNRHVYMTGRDTHLDIDGHLAVAEELSRFLSH